MWLLWAWWSRSLAAAAAVGAPGPRSPSAVIAPGHGVAPATDGLDPTTRAERAPGAVETSSGVTRDRVAYQLRDEDVLRALQQRQPAFMRCYRRAKRDDLMLDRATVRLYVQVGPTGAVDVARADGGTRALADCVVAVARQLTFAPPAMVIDVELPLYFVNTP
ncbi:MAG: hypothetical protein K8W52_13500 [Deltaproteobacteria bacterium]|nr:hypothetical protein [Deltaproteobacteria bacterium]